MTALATPPTAVGARLLQLADGWTGACLGLLFYGGWAVWANSDYGWQAAARAGALHGSISFLVTLSGTLLMKQLFRGSGSPLWRGARACMGALCIIYTIVLGAHWINGTPEILLTIAPGLPITLFFCLSFCLGLARYGLPPTG